MEYPKKFKDRCKKIYPDWDDLHDMLNREQTLAGRYLCDSSLSNIPIKAVLNFVRNKDMNGLKEMCDRELEKLELYVEWQKLYDAEFK